MIMESRTCDNCERTIEYPAMLNMHGTIRVRCGVNSPMGYDRVEMRGKDFCDPGCMETWISREAHRVNPYTKIGNWNTEGLEGRKGNE